MPGWHVNSWKCVPPRSSPRTSACRAATFTRLAILALLPLFLAGCAILTPPYSGEAIEGTIIDPATQQPLAGAVVVARWDLRGGGPMDSISAGTLMVMESVTDELGRFRLPAWGPIKQMTGELEAGAPELIIFKPDYEFRRLFNESNGELAAMRWQHRSQWSGKVVPLVEWNDSDQKYAQHVRELDRTMNFARDGEDCEWQKTPRMFLAIDQMAARFEAEGIRLPAWRGGDRIKRLGDMGRQDKCGSAVEFFQRHGS